MNFGRTWLFLSLFALGAVAAETPPPPPPGGGGDAGTKPKAASMVIEEEQAADEPPPPAPTGDEKRAIGDYVRDNSGAITDCYARRLQERPTLQGKLVARFDIGANGRVIGAMADGIADKELIACVVQIVRKWEFEKPASGGKLRIAYPFRFEPKPAR
jgi:outer membrane biosynthesis protein TonB